MSEQHVVLVTLLYHDTRKKRDRVGVRSFHDYAWGVWPEAKFEVLNEWKRKSEKAKGLETAVLDIELVASFPEMDEDE